MSQLLYEAGSCLAYGAVSIVLMVLGFWFTDLMTPGKLADLIWNERRVAPAIHVGAGLFATSWIVRQAILSSEDHTIISGVTSTFTYGLLGLVMMAFTFWLIDVITPGKLSEMVVAEKLHPAIIITAVTHLAVGLIIAAAIS